MVSTRRNLNNQTASAEPEIVNSGRIAKKRRSNGPQKRLSTHIKNIIVDKCLRKESMKKAEVARMFGVSWQTVDNIVEKYVRDGTVEPKKRGGCRQKNIKIHQEHSCHDEVEEYGALEAGKAYDGEQATKRLEEGYVKLPKCLKDMLDSILPKCDDNQKLQTIGFIHSGLQSYVIRADRPTKYITRIQKSRNYHLSSDISQFGTTVLPAIYIAWVIKDIVRNTYNIIKESNTRNNNSNIQGSEWLTQYWEESEKEDGPETSSSQEKILKKNKSVY